MNNYLRSFYNNKKILITGGLGFIGSSLAIKLVELGCSVTILDAMIPEYGGNLFNIAPVKEKVKINFSNITDVSSVNYLVRGQDLIFHCAGQVCHVMSLSNPFPDIEYNITGTAVLMEACKKFNPNAIVIYTGTRGQYGETTKLPVDEKAPTNPRGIYEISNLAAEKIIQVYNDIHGIRSVMLRLTNIYGPRSQMKHSRFGIVNWFIRQAIDNEVISVFGDGKIIRDFLYIDDCIDAMILAPTYERAFGEIFNVGIDQKNNFIELVSEIIAVVKKGSWKFSEFSHERKVQEPGDFYSDITKIKSILEWAPKIKLRQGIGKTVDYYLQFKGEYW